MMAPIQSHNTQVWLTPTHVSPWCWQPICLFPGCQRRRLGFHSVQQEGEIQPFDILAQYKCAPIEFYVWYFKELVLKYFRQHKMDIRRHLDTENLYLNRRWFRLDKTLAIPTWELNFSVAKASKTASQNEGIRSVTVPWRGLGTGCFCLCCQSVNQILVWNLNWVWSLCCR